MPSVGHLVSVLERLAPPLLAESWDNVGLLVGDRDRPVARVMTCLTLTPESAAEAIEKQAEAVVTHHPLPFQPISRITTDTTAGRLLWDLIGARIAVYSPHTAFDSAFGGINEQLAAGLGLTQIEPLSRGELAEVEVEEGSGRCGMPDAPSTLADIARHAKEFLSLSSLRLVGDDRQPVQRVAVACGSGGSFLAAAHARGCDCLVTGEASFHGCLEAAALGIGLVLAGHFATERFALVRLADELRKELVGVEVWASEREQDPLRVA
jgi:dinuclear metal center YbgI/SA1388 family protein